MRLDAHKIKFCLHMSEKSSNFVPDFNRVYIYTRKIAPLAILCITCANFAHNKNYTLQNNERRDSFVPAK